MKLYFARHGESEANLLHVVSNRDAPHALTENGRAQAGILARRLAGIPLSRIYASPVLRAVQTAEIVSRALDVPLEICPALREYDCGEIEGRSDVECWRIHAETRRAWLREQDWTRRIPGGESFEDIRARFVPFVEGLVQEFGAGEESFLLLGHGGTYACMLPLVLENVSFETAGDLPFDYTTLITAEARAGRLVCLDWNGIPMLKTDA